MSRRRSRIEEIEVTTEVHEWWWTQPMPEPWEAYLWSEWQEAWADITLSVCYNVWLREGAKLYAAHRDHLLREDLQDWLWVQAVSSIRGFTPDPDHGAPERQWAAYLYGFLRPKARHHFGDVVGSEHYRADAVIAHRRGIASIDHLDAMEDETGYVVDRHPLHGHDLISSDPESVLIRIENFDHEVHLVETERRSSGMYTTASNGLCIITGCGNPSKVRGLCDTHWRHERELWGASQGRTCNIPDCGGTHKGKGLCSRHIQLLWRGTLPPELHQYVEEGRKPGVPRTSPAECIIDGCTKTPKARGWCSAHWERWKRYGDPLGSAEPKPAAPPCSIPGCEKTSAARGWCPMHYQRWRKERAS